MTDDRTPLRASTRPWGLAWLALLVLPVIELVGHAVVQSRVPSDDDWRQALAYVRSEHREKDLVVSAPDWTAPLLRQYAGTLVTVREAARADDEAWERLFVVSIRGRRAPGQPTRTADQIKTFGHVRVERYDLGRSRVLHDLTSDVVPDRARVEWVQNGVAQPCSWRLQGGFGGGLGAGAYFPASRFQCDGAPPWVWVGETVIEDLHLQPRRCIWQHANGPEPVRTTIPDVPLGDRIVLYGGLYYEAERMLERGPIDVVLKVDGMEIGRMTHHDGDGWQRMEALTHPSDARTRGDVSIEVTASPADYRQLCWAAQVLDGPARGAAQ